MNATRESKRPSGGGIATLLALAAALAASQVHAVPLEVYGQLPSIEQIALSPDGKRIALVRTEGNFRTLGVYSLITRQLLSGLRVGDAKLRRIEWADNDHVLIVSSAPAHAAVMEPKSEWEALQIYDVTTRRARVLPDPARRVGIATLDAISEPVLVRHLDGRTVLFVRGFYSEQGHALPLLLRIDLASGAEDVIRKGSVSTEAWLIDGAGTLTAEMDYDEQQQHWSVSRLVDGRMQEVFGGQTAVDVPELLGFGSLSGSVITRELENGAWVWRQRLLAGDTPATLVAPDTPMLREISDSLTGVVVGGEYVENDVQYRFFIPAMQRLWDTVVQAFPDERVLLVSVAADFRTLVVRVEGQRDGYQYRLVDLHTSTSNPIGDVYSGVTTPLSARRIDYSAADGLQIPAYLILPPGREPRHLPLIVFPHGGPQSRDTGDFNWWAQALAQQGYAVLQPNFRGSAITEAFVEAGFGQFGRKMQSDLSDGVRFLVQSGVVDPGRVCIEGGSYGGYAALAAVTLEQGVYRCAVSVAGISDVKQMLLSLKGASAQDPELELRYWVRLLGITHPEDAATDALSPIKHVDAVTVPVLLIHGQDDTVVPFTQSQAMYSALHRAHKQVQLITLKGEDHWLSRSETRLQMLEASVNFLRRYNPPN